MTPPSAGRAGSALVWPALGVVYVVWGSTYLFIALMVETVPPLLGAGTRFAVAGAVMLLVLRALGRRVGLTRPTAAGAALLGVLLPAGGNGLVTVGQQHGVPSGLAALLVATVPLWVVVLRASAGREHVAPRQVLGVLVGFAGVALLLSPGGAGGGAWVLLVLLAAASWATGSFLASRLRLPGDVLVSTAWQLTFGGLALLLGAALTGERVDPGAVSGRSLLGLAYLVVLGSWLAYAAYAWLLQHAPLSQVATYAYVNPVVAVVLGWAVLAEPVTATTIVGAAVVVGSVAITVRRPAGRAASTARPASGSA